jgi:hypothetical protein
MKNKINYSISLGIGMIALAVMIAPSISSAATYAYVNESGDVSTVVATDPYIAIDTAPNRTTHSGVILLMEAGDYNILN